MSGIPQVLAEVMARRAGAGLVLRFMVPGRPADLQPFVCYPKDEADKVKWLRQAAARGWEGVRP
jgi:hypothetical protein